jgi:hypothetical protein
MEPTRAVDHLRPLRRTEQAEEKLAANQSEGAGG